MRLVALVLASLVLAPPALAQSSPWDRIPHEGGWIQVRPDGRIGRFLQADDWRREHEIRAAAAAGRAIEPAVWTTKIFILRRIDADWKDAAGNARHTTVEFSPERVETFRRVAETFVEWVRILSDGAVELDAEIVVLDGPLTRLDEWGDCVHPWAGSMDSLLAPHVEPGAVDSVLVFWPPGDLPHRNYWGLTSWGICRGAGYSWVVDLGGTIDERAYAEVSLHEWLHQMEAVRSGIQGYAGMPALHDGGRMGYRADLDQPGWMLYYRDFMRAYMTPAMWRGSNPRAAAARRPRAAFEGGFVGEWLVAGPFPNADDLGLDREVEGEAACRPAADEPFGEHRWRRVESGPVLDLDRTLSPNEHVVGYAHVYVRSPSRRVAAVWVGSDDGVAVRVNGREVWRNHVHRGCGPDQDRFEVLLAPGWNRFLFKVDEGVGGWGLQTRFSRPDGTPWPDLEISADRPADGASIAGEDEDPIPLDARWRHATFDWRAVRDDPWALLPELDQARLRWIARDPELRLETGDNFTAVLPGASRASARFPAAPTSGAYRVDNTLDLGAESVAWLRYERDGVRRDLVLLRADVAGWWLEALDAFDDPVVHVVGKVTAGNRPLVAVETRLALDDGPEPPPTELHLARAADRELSVSLRPEWRSAADESVRCRARVVNLTDRAIEVASVAIPGGGPLASAPFSIPAFGRWEVAFDLGLAGRPPGPLPLVLEVVRRTGGADRTVRARAAVEVKKALEASILDAATGRTGRALLARLVLANHRHRPAVLALDVEIPAGWRLDPGFPATVEIPAAGVLEVPLPLTAGTPAPGETATLRVVARAEGDAPVAAEVAWRRSPWLLAGPYDNAGEKGFDVAYPPEAPDFDGWIDLVPAAATASPAEVEHLAIFRPAEWQAAYAAADLVVDEAVKATLRFGSDDTITVWLDGAVVLARNVYRPAAPGQDAIEVDLAPGRHRLLVKVCQGAGGWKFYFDTPTPGVRLEPAR